MADQRFVENRPDVATWVSAPLDRDLAVVGPVRVVLWAATDAPDTDWTAKLVDVRPNGFAMNLCDGIVRARWRHALSGDATEGDLAECRGCEKCADGEGADESEC